MIKMCVETPNIIVTRTRSRTAPWSGASNKRISHRRRFNYFMAFMAGIGVYSTRNKLIGA